MQDERRFHLAREVRFGELIAALSIISGVAMGYVELRLRPVEAQLAAADLAALEFKRELREDLKRLNDKLDRLIEQSVRR